MTRMFFRSETSERSHSLGDTEDRCRVERKYEVVGEDGQQKVLLRYWLKPDMLFGRK
jgi:hypothetical protein